MLQCCRKRSKPTKQGCKHCDEGAKNSLYRNAESHQYMEGPVVEWCPGARFTLEAHQSIRGGGRHLVVVQLLLRAVLDCPD